MIISWTSQATSRLLQFPLALQIVSERLPLRGILLTVGFHFVGVDELLGIAVVQIIVALVRIGNHIIMQDEVGEYPAVPITNETIELK